VIAGRRIPLLLVCLIALLACAGPGEARDRLDPHDLLGSFRRFQHSRAPGARAIAHEIRNGPRDLKRERAAARREGIPLSVAELQPPSPPSALNAAPLYARLEEVMKARPADQRSEEMVTWVGTGFTQTPEELAAVRRYLLDRRDVMDLIHQAADRPLYVFPHQWDLGSDILLFSRNAVMREAERLLRAESYLQAAAGHYEEAITSQARGFRIADQAASDPSLIPTLVGIACDALALAGMRDILYLAGPNAAVAERVETAIAARRPSFSMRHALAGEVVTHLLYMETLRREGVKGLIETLTEKPAPLSRRPTRRERELCGKIWDAAETAYLQQMRRAMRVAEQPYPACLAQFRRLDQQWMQFVAPTTNDPAHRVLAYALPSFLEQSATAIALARAREDVVIAGAELLAYKGRHGAWPARLEDAMPSPPTDPFSGRPLEYRQEVDGFVVYSVGRTGKFDGGKPGSGRYRNEVYFRYPAPPPRPHPRPLPSAAQPPWPPPFPLPHPHAVLAVAFSPDGQRLATGSAGRWTPTGDDDPKLKLSELSTAKPLWAKPAHRYAVKAVAFSPDGRQIATGSGDDQVRLWDASTGALLRTLPGHGYSVNSVAFSPDGRWLASVGSDTLKLWDVRTGRLVRTPSVQGAWLEAVAFSPDGRLVAGGGHDSTIRIWHARSGRLLRTLKGHRDWVKSLAFSPDGQRLVSGSGDGTVKCWHVRLGRLAWTSARTDWVNSVAFSPDGKLVASGHESETDKSPGTVRLWNAQTGKLLRTLTGHRYAVNSVTFSPDGRQLASGSDDATVKLWEVPSGAPQRTISADPK
jgi:sugar lactone lactonase YvrE